MKLVYIWKYVILDLKSLKNHEIRILGFWLFHGDVWKPLVIPKVLRLTRFWKQTEGTFIGDVCQHI